MKKWALLAVVGAAFGLLLAVGLANSPALAASPECTTCHNQAVTVTFSGGDKVTATVDAQTYAASAHAQLPCSTCHADITAYPHPKLTANTERAWQLSFRDSCQACHAAVYTEMNTTSHAVAWAVSTCTDCHDAHATNAAKPAITPKYFSCVSCHPEVGNSYLDSVHGAAVTGGVGDLPYCTTCHQAHQFNVKPTRAESVTICSDCHSNADLMAKHGISDTTVSTYLHDFHGKTAILEGKQGTTVDVAVCTDCHGVHTIKTIDVSNALTTVSGASQACEQCHPGKQEQFATAFLAHATPTPAKDTLIFIVDWFYRLMIPFVLIGLLIHIAFDVRQARKHKKGVQHGGS